MKITDISCTQFAGIRDRKVSLTDGINIIYGKNESGKSTLVNLMSRTLFQNAKLDRRTDKDFSALYFPSSKKDGGISGDFVDGEITFETENGTYTLSKEWGSDSRCNLSTPDGVIRDQNKIDETLKEALLYGEGVYSDMLFSSQRNTDISLQTILDASKKTDAKQEITNIVSQAFAESDGISVDVIEQKIKEKIDEIAGKHWDFEREVPTRNKTGERWKSSLGEILNACYKLVDAKAELKRISDLEAEVDRALSDFKGKDKAATEANEIYENFNKFAAQLAIQSESKKNERRLTDEISKFKDILLDWPKLTENLEKAKALEKEKLNRELLNKYESAKAIREEIEKIEKTIPTYQPTDDEIATVKTAQNYIAKLENKLCGMNISAAIKLFDGNSIEITSLRTGEKIDIANGTAAITEAVKITVPGIMEMQLSPADVDVALIEIQIAEQKSKITEIFAKYKVEALEELEYLKLYQAVCSEIDVVGKEIAVAVNPTFKIDNNTNIKKWGYEIQQRFPNIKDIGVVFNSEDILQPYKDWEYEKHTTVDSNGKIRNNLKIKDGKKAIKWWQKYNTIKHRRIGLVEGTKNFRLANQSNLILAFSALFLLESIYIIYFSKDECVKVSKSRLFAIKDDIRV